MKSQSEVVSEVIAKVTLTLPEVLTTKDHLKAFEEIGRLCYQAGFSHGAIKGQTHMANAFDKVFRASP